MLNPLQVSPGSAPNRPPVARMMDGVFVVDDLYYIPIRPPTENNLYIYISIIYIYIQSSLSLSLFVHLNYHIYSSIDL
jgi:hypothetical protein